MIVLLILLVVICGGGWIAGRLVGELFFGGFISEEKKSTYTFHSTHVHHHHHEHKNISIIDDFTKKKIFELKDFKDKK